MTEHPLPNEEPVQPTIRDAIVGALIGGALIYAGWRTPYRIASWIIIGVGVLFVVVMTGAIVVMGWQHASPRARLVWAGWRGHVRRDPLLGALIRNVKGGYWESTIAVGDRTIDIVIEGSERPLEALVGEARALVGDFDALERRVSAYLVSERTSGRWGDAELEAEIGALRIASLNFRWPKRTNRVEIDFAGADEGRFWSCLYRNGRCSGLQFDS